MKLKINKNLFEAFFNSSLKAILPTLVFLTIYFSVHTLFGSGNGIIVTSITLIFRRLRSERFIEREIFKTTLIFLILSVLASLASESLATTIVMNLIVPFFIVYVITDDYKPGGDFPFTMIFMQMQLIPVNFSELKIRMLAITFGLVIVYIALKLFIFFKPTDTEHSICKKGLENIIDQYNSLINKDLENTKKQQLKLFEISEKLSQLIYNREKSKYFTGSSHANYFNFIIIFQHTDNLTSKIRHNPQLLTEYNINYFKKLVLLIKETLDNFDNPNQEHIISKLVDFSGKNSVDDLILNTDLLFNIDAMIIALSDISSAARRTTNRRRRDRLILQNELKRPTKLKHRMNVSSFKFCFGVRLSIVMTIAFTTSFMLDKAYSYWLPMSAFLMVRPFYDESKKRIIRRIIGTIIGIIISFGLSYVLNDTWQLFVFTIIFVFGMYAAEDYAVVVVFATCFALLTIIFASNSTGAIWLRLIYTVLGGVISMLASKYILPVKYYDEFKNMANRIIDIDIMMAESLCRLAFNINDGDTFRELIIESYMVSGQLESMYYSSKIEKDDNFIKDLVMVNNQLVTYMANAYDLLSIQNIPADKHKKLMTILYSIRKNLNITRIIMNGGQVSDINNNMDDYLVHSSIYINKIILDCLQKSLEFKNIVYSNRGLT